MSGSGGSVIREMVAMVSVQMDGASEKDITSRLFRLRTAVGGLVAGFATATAFDWAKSSAAFDDAFAVFKTAGGDLEKLRQQTKGLISDMKLVKIYNTADQFGLKQFTGDFFAIANAAFRKNPGKFDSVGDALNMVITGVARHSARLLENVGIDIIGQQTKILKAYAVTIGVTYDKLSSAQIRTGLALAAISRSKEGIDQVAKSGATAQDNFTQLEVAVSNLKNGAGQLIASALVPLIPAIRSFITEVQKIAQSEDAKRFLHDLEQGFALVWLVVKPLVYEVGGLVKAFLHIPYIGSIVGAVIRTQMVPAFLGLFLMFNRIIPIMKLYKTLSEVMALSQIFGARVMATAIKNMIMEVWGPMLISALETAAVIAVLIFAFEELFAMFDDSKIGLFEKWGGSWDKLILRMGKAPARGLWAQWFKWLGIHLVYITATLISDLTKFAERFSAVALIVSGHFSEGIAAFRKASAEGLARNTALDKALDWAPELNGNSETNYDPLSQHSLRSLTEGPRYQLPTPGAAAAYRSEHNTTININGAQDPAEVGRIVKRIYDGQAQDAQHALTPSKPIK